MTSPDAFDRWWVEFLRMSKATSQEERMALLERLFTEPDVFDGLSVAIHGLRSQLRRICDDDPSAENLWSITGLIHHQMLLPRDAEGRECDREDVYRLLHLILSQGVDALSQAEAMMLVDLVWALDLPQDAESSRAPVLGKWLHDLNRTLDPTDPPTAELLEAVKAVVPEGWDQIDGTVMMASGQVLANLSITFDPAARSPYGETGRLSRLLHVPETQAFRVGEGLSWWRAEVAVSRTDENISVIREPGAIPSPQTLLRISDYRADLNANHALQAPPWLDTYCQDGRIDYGFGPRTVIGPAEAISLASQAAVSRGIGRDFDLDRLVAVRLPVGYRVFMFQAPDTPFGELILDAPVFYVGDDCRIYEPRAGRAEYADQEFRAAFAERNDYDSTTGARWQEQTTTVIGPLSTS